MNVEREEWARAFLRQASSDLAVYDLLERQPQQEFPRCHSLHYLQMACEKVAKAYRTRETDAVLHGDVPRLSLLRGAGGRTLLKLVREAVRQF